MSAARVETDMLSADRLPDFPLAEMIARMRNVGSLNQSGWRALVDSEQEPDSDGSLLCALILWCGPTNSRRRKQPSDTGARCSRYWEST